MTWNAQVWSTPIKKLFVYSIFIRKKLYCVGCAKLCSTSVVILMFKLNTKEFFRYAHNPISWGSQKTMDQQNWWFSCLSHVFSMWNSVHFQDVAILSDHCVCLWWISHTGYHDGLKNQKGKFMLNAKISPDVNIRM